MGSHSNKFNSLRYSFVRVLFKQLIIKMMKSPFSPSPFLRLSLLSQRLKHPLTHTMVMLDMVMVMVDMVVGMVMVFMADTDMVDTAVDTDTDTTLAKDPLMLMLKPAQLCSWCLWTPISLRSPPIRLCPTQISRCIQLPTRQHPSCHPWNPPIAQA